MEGQESQPGDKVLDLVPQEREWTVVEDMYQASASPLLSPLQKDGSVDPFYR